MTQLGRYQLVSKLASGGMAEVFLSRAAGPGDFEKTLVLKRILPHLAEDPAFVEMFLSEARLAARLEHPNIVQIFDFGQADGTYYLAMEYIDGLNLRALMKKARKAQRLLPPAVCARILTLACEGLAYAHDRTDPATGEPLHLIHRDISPDNIMLSRQGAVKVVDFGIAKVADQGQRIGTQPGMVKGKLSYMAPEQFHGLVLDRRADVYALGVVLYELLTGQKPHEAPTEASLMQAILVQLPVPALQLRPDLPQALQLILDRALAKEREQRYPDCRALQADLERFILSTGEPVGAWQLAQWVEGLIGVPAQTSSGLIAVQFPAPGTGEPAPARAPAGSLAPSKPLDKPLDKPLEEPEELEPPEGTTELHDTFSRRSARWVLVAVGVGAVVLGAVGAGVYWRKRPAPVPVPEVAARPEPPAPHEEPPPAAPAPVLAATPPPAPSAAVPSAAVPMPAPATPSAPAPAVADAASTPEPAAQEPPATATPTRPRPVRPAEAPAAKGSVDFRVRPYATVVINGRSLGQTPMAPVSLTAGTYTVKLINKELGKVATRRLEVLAGQSTVFKYDLLNE